MGDDDRDSGFGRGAHQQPGSEREREIFLSLQMRLEPMFREVYADPLAEHARSSSFPA